MRSRRHRPRGSSGRMLSCDDMENFVPFVTERVKVDLGRLKVFADRREPETTPVYFKSKFLPRDQVERDRQIEFEYALTATGLLRQEIGAQMVGPQSRIGSGRRRSGLTPFEDPQRDQDRAGTLTCN